MLRLRDSRRTSLSAPQQHRNPQPESIARNRYQMSQSAVAWRLSPFNGLQGSRLRAIFVAKTDQMADNLPHNPEHPGKDRFYPRCGGGIGEEGQANAGPGPGVVSRPKPPKSPPGRT